LKEASPFKENKPKEKQEEVEDLESDEIFKKKKILYNQEKHINEKRNFLKMNFYMY